MNEADFYRFMHLNGPESDGSKRNYLSWLRYVNLRYSPNFNTLTREEVDNIIKDLHLTKNTRNEYKTDRDISNIKSAINKYLSFNRDQESEVIKDVAAVLGEIKTTSKTEIETRLGQGKYRNEVINIWHKCAVTEIDRVDILIASHIKPWKCSTEIERLDPFNGLLLCPNLDKLFDRGYISFDRGGRILISTLLTDFDLMRLGISRSMKLYKIEQSSIPYLEFHRSEILV